METGGTMADDGPYIDWASFAAHIQAELRRSNILVGELPNMVKLYRSTVSDAANGRQCSVEVFIALCLWMGVRPNRFFRLGSVDPHFFLFKAPDSGTAPARDISESQLVPSVADCGSKPRVASDRPVRPSNEVRGFRGKPPKIGGPSIDWTAFAEYLRGRMHRFNISLRELQRLSGVHYSTLSRVVNGKQCLAVTYLTLCAWMMLEPTKFYRGGSA